MPYQLLDKGSYFTLIQLLVYLQFLFQLVSAAGSLTQDTSLGSMSCEEDQALCPDDGRSRSVP